MGSEQDNLIPKEQEQEKYVKNVKSYNKQSIQSKKELILNQDDNFNEEEGENAMEGIQDARKTRFLYDKIQTIDIAAFNLTFISMVLTVLQYDVRIKN